MFPDILQKLAAAAKSKVGLLNESTAKYIFASLLAGLYVGIGIFLIMAIGGVTKAMGPAFKVYMGLGFGIALSLVIMAGSELFTGNNLILTAGALDRSVKWRDAGRIWGTSYVGNLIGSIICGALFVYTAPSEGISDFIVNLSAAKMGTAPLALIARGILCNILVCLAVLCAVRMKSESGKLIMIFWCLFAFITSGYSHSIANMSIFTAGLLLPHGETVSIGGAVMNLVWVTLGNMIGGCLLGWVYWFMGRTTKTKENA